MKKTIGLATKADLKEEALKMARDLASKINKTIPESVSDMPYARQCTLEYVVQFLSEAI